MTKNLRLLIVMPFLIYSYLQRTHFLIHVSSKSPRKPSIKGKIIFTKDSSKLKKKERKKSSYITSKRLEPASGCSIYQYG